MATTAKVTKKDMFEALLKVDGIVGNKEFEDFIKHEIELLDNKKKVAYFELGNENEEVAENGGE